MPSQEPDVRNKNFDEVALGYTAEQAVDEGNRCLNCKTDHVWRLPGKYCHSRVHSGSAEGDFEGLPDHCQTSSLPAICGRVCPQESQCEAKCVRGIKGEPVAIGRLERFVADWHNDHSKGSPQTARSPTAARWRSSAPARPG